MESQDARPTSLWLGIDGWQLESGELEPLAVGEQAELVAEFMWVDEPTHLDAAPVSSVQWVEGCIYDVRAPAGVVGAYPYLDLGVKIPRAIIQTPSGRSVFRGPRDARASSGRVRLEVSISPESPELDPFVRAWVPERILERSVEDDWRDVRRTRCDSAYAYQVLCRPVLNWSHDDQQAAVERRRRWREHEPTSDDLEDDVDTPPTRSRWFDRRRTLNFIVFADDAGRGISSSLRRSAVLSKLTHWRR